MCQRAPNHWELRRGTQQCSLARWLFFVFLVSLCILCLNSLVFSCVIFLLGHSSAYMQGNNLIFFSFCVCIDLQYALLCFTLLPGTQVDSKPHVDTVLCFIYNFYMFSCISLFCPTQVDSKPRVDTVKWTRAGRYIATTFRHVSRIYNHHNMWNS